MCRARIRRKDNYVPAKTGNNKVDSKKTEQMELDPNLGVFFLILSSQ